MPPKKKYDRELITQELEQAGLSYGMTARSGAIRTAPETFDAERRAVRFIATTEQPATVWDWERYDFVDEVLLADGMVMPRIGQVPLLDTHSRRSVKDVLGSARDFKTCETAGMRAIDCEVQFASTRDGQDAATKVEGGHLTDVSVGYHVKESYWIPDGEKQVIKGREYEGPLKVSTQWELKELSLAPIGADSLAKARAATRPQREEHAMNKRLRDFLEARGLPKGATEQEAWDFLGTLDVQARSEAGNAGGITSEELETRLEQVRQEANNQARIDERTRIAEITDRCRVAGMDEDFIRTHVDGGTSVEEVSKAIFASLKEKSPAIGAGAQSRASIGIEAGEKFRAAAVDGLMMRSGMRLEKPAAGANIFRGRSLLEIARESLELAGVDTRSLSRRELAARALTPASTSDFPYLFAEVTNKSLIKAYNEWPATWKPFVARTDAVDFKTLHAIKLSGAPDLADLNENGEYQTAEFSDAQETYRVVTKGRIVRLTREMVINDDLRAFTRVPQLFGVAARRMENAAVYSLLTSNPTMSDGEALFSAAHANITTSGAVLSHTTLSAGREMMRLQTGLNGEPLDIQPAFVIVPVAQETAAEILLRSMALPEGTYSSGVLNPWAGKLTPIADPALDAASITAGWFLLAHPSQAPTIEVAYLEGEEQPYVDDEIDFDSDSLKIKVRHDFGAGVVDYVGAYFNDGAT